MTPPSRRELFEAAIFDATRLSRDLGMMAPDALGRCRTTAHYYRRDDLMAVVTRIIVDLKEAMEKEGVSSGDAP